MSMNIYDMEVNSRMENLVDFKKAYAKAFQAVSGCLELAHVNYMHYTIHEMIQSFVSKMLGPYEH